MKILALVENCTKEDYEIVIKVVSSIFGSEPLIIDGDRRQDWPWDPDLILTFGQEAYENAIGMARHFIPLPGPSRLVNKEGNEDAREFTWNKLNEAKKLLDVKLGSGQDNSLSKESEPPDSVIKLDKVSSHTWSARTRDGKTIRLSKRPEEGSEDIRLTYDELYALKVAKDLLGVEEFTLVPSTKANPSSRS
jgi:hypothetical protein